MKTNGEKHMDGAEFFTASLIPFAVDHFSADSKALNKNSSWGPILV
jgi:hypothetical protein